MDALYFNTKNKVALFEELGLYREIAGEENEPPTKVSVLEGNIYESPNNWAIVWLGKLPADTETRTDEEGMEYEEVTEWQEGEFFNIYLRGQDNMDYFTKQLNNAKLLRKPATPNMKLL